MIRIAMLLLFAMVASPALAEDWDVMGRGTVTIGRDEQKMWIADHPDLGPQARIEGSGGGVLLFEAVPNPAGKPYLPKPSVQVSIDNPLHNPTLAEVHYRDAEGINYVADTGAVEAVLKDRRWIIKFSAELEELDPTTWAPSEGGDTLTVRGDFDLEAAVL